MAVAIFWSGVSHAQVDCRYRSLLGATSCVSYELSQINGDIIDILRNKVGQAAPDERESLLTGIEPWAMEVEERCLVGWNDLDYDCVREMLEHRREAMRIVGEGGSYTTNTGYVWMNLASRISRAEAEELAYEYYLNTGRRYSFTVFLSRNGWYGIAYGPIRSEEFDWHLSL